MSRRIESFSKINSETINFGWTIDNFTDLDDTNGSSVYSIPFNCGGYQWYICLCPNGNAEPDAGFLSVYLYLTKELPTGTTRIDSKYEFSLLNPEDKALHSAGQQKVVYTSVEGYGSHKFCQRSDILDESKGLLSNKKLKIGLELTVTMGLERGILEPVDQHKLPQNNNMADFPKFLDDSTFTDAEIVDADGEAKGVHKIILAQSLSVLARMFSTRMKEGLKSHAEITNINAGTLTELLNYIYSGNVNQTGNVELLKDLILAADYFEIFPLKEHCESLLIKNLAKTHENAIGLLERGQLLSCSRLKEAAVRSIVMNKTDILNTDGWKDFIVRNPDLAQEVIFKVANVSPKRPINEVDGEVNAQPRR